MKEALFYIMFTSALLAGCKTVKQHKPFDDEGGKIKITRESKWGGNSTIAGVVKDLKNGEGIPMAKIIISNRDGNQLGTLSDEKGRFMIKNISYEYYRLTISAMDYEKIEQSLDMREGGLFSVEAELKEWIIRIEKPVIYLYPEKKQQVHVRLEFDGKLTHTYPKYPPEGWKIVAEPNGTLKDARGQEYYALFWEGQPREQIVPRDGFVVAGKETALFLEEKLADLGLNRREANEFVVHWLPQMEKNPFNFIHFASKAYEEKAKLEITPEPETVIRVMMLTQPLRKRIDFPLQNLKPLKKKRKGFTVVEWGGSILHDEFHSLIKQ